MVFTFVAKSNGVNKIGCLFNKTHNKSFLALQDFCFSSNFYRLKFYTYISMSVVMMSVFSPIAIPMMISSSSSMIMVKVLLKS